MNHLILQLALSSLALGLLPAQAQESWSSGDDLMIDLLASHPVVEQPAFLNFDHRGRLWVAQFREYPFPAGAKLTGRDRFWRNEYDKLPAAPGEKDYVPGKDRITIHEDSNGDGFFDKASTFLEGLNLCTSFTHGGDGLWVLQPPYLLFYSDKNKDDIPDSNPEIHLKGFGIEDSHALANSLCWGPDGWLYGANGSTTSLNITVTGSDAAPVMRQGQLVWRFHPIRRQFEIFAEGGGNNWSCEFDSAGRLYSGSNNASAGYYYLQGAYYEKNFGKHGGLSNQNTYGFFKGIPHRSYSRVTNSIIIYEEDSLPSRFHNSLIFANPLDFGIGSYRTTLAGLNFMAQPNGTIAVRKDDPWYCPVYVESGPDGALYICDWYDQQCNHYRNSEGNISPNDGRLFRIRSHESQPLAKFDLSQATVSDLLDHLRSPRRWWREQARRLLRQHPRRNQALPILKKWLRTEKERTALEALWALHSLEAFDQEIFEQSLKHPYPHVRRWGLRLASDHRQLSAEQLAATQDHLAQEDNLECLSQLASSAARLPAKQALTLLELLLRNENLAADEHLRLQLWWTIERHCLEAPESLVALLENSEIRQNPHAPALTAFLIRRLASDGSKSHLLLCKRLFQIAKDFETPEKQKLWIQFEAAFEGQSLSTLPPGLLTTIREHEDLPFYLRLRLQIPGTIEQALARLESKDSSGLFRIVEYFGEHPDDRATPHLLTLLDSTDHKLLEYTLGSLQSIPSPEVATAVIAKLNQLPPTHQNAARVLLLSRPAWTELWLDAALQDPELAQTLTRETRTRIARIPLPILQKKLARLFPNSQESPLNTEEEIQRLTRIFEKGLSPDPAKGYQLYQKLCASCHRLHNEGGFIGPGLTSYQRNDPKTLLLAIVSPNAEIRAGYEPYTLETKDGRSIFGFLKSQTDQLLVIQPAGGTPLSFNHDQVENLQPSSMSLMPPALLSGLSEQELSDFFAYLRSPQPLNLRKN